MKGFAVVLALPAVFTLWAGEASADSTVFENHTAVATLSAGIPSGVNLAGDMRLNDRFSAGIALGGFGAKAGNNPPISLSTGNLELRGRWHSFGGSFFLGMLLGGRTLAASGTQDIDVGGGTMVPTTVEMKIRSGYLTPHLGWIWVFGRGFTLGTEIGLQVPIRPGSSIDATIDDPTLNSYLTAVEGTQQYRDLEKDIEDMGKTIGRIRLPHFVIRLGWAF